MIYVIKTENNDVIIFDSVTSLSESYAGSVTSHPVESGAKISDHVITENVKFKISGVVSDYNFYNPLKDYINQSVPAYDFNRKDYLNRVNSSGQLEELSEDTYDYPGSDKDGSFSIKSASEMVKDKLKEIQRNGITLTLLEYTTNGNDSLINSYTNCVITDVSFSKTPDSGYAIYPELSIEQINVVPVVVTQAEARKIVPQAVADQAAADAGKDGKSKGNSEGDGDKAKTKQELHLELENRRDIAIEINNCSEQWVENRDKGSRVVPQCVFDIKRKYGVDVKW